MNHFERRACRPNFLFVMAAVAFLVPTANATVAFAQTTVAPPGDQGSPSNGAGGVQSAGTGGGGSRTSTTVQTFPGGVAPLQPGQTLGGGNVGNTSSSKPIQGTEEDHFDLGPKAGGGGTAFGSDNGPVFLGEGDNHSTRLSGGVVPNVHTVRKGDTLWDLCDSYFQNPYQWPRVWSYNPQLQNPHWIFPGDQIRLRGGAGTAAIQATGPSGRPLANDNGSLIDRRRQVPSDTVFLRDEGFVDDNSDDNWGEIDGAPVDKMFLTDLDEVYLKLGDKREVKLGQELTIFRPIRSVAGGKLVQIQGTVRVNQWNPKEHIARAQITESLDVIERGARIGPVGRRFTIVPPVRNSVDMRVQILASIHPHNFYGQNQVVFIDKGEQDGLKVGNRLFIIRKGDAWKNSLATSAAATRIALESDSPAAVEKVPTPPNAGVLPEEVVGELRIVAMRAHSATAVVTQSTREIEMQDDAVARKGY
ncbi:MAG: LysM peptidoglycan-binding domain-containing protein [Polyangiaceae bacterium]